jgi:hypothetical protein
MRCAQVRHVEIVAQVEFHRSVLRHGHTGIIRHREMHGDHGVGGADHHRHTMAFQQKVDLLFQIALEQVRAGHGRGIDARFRDMAKRQAAVRLGMGRRCQPDFGIERTEPPVGLTIAQGGDKVLGQEPHRRGIEVVQARHGFFGSVNASCGGRSGVRMTTFCGAFMYFPRTDR